MRAIPQVTGILRGRAEDPRVDQFRLDVLDGQLG